MGIQCTSFRIRDTSSIVIGGKAEYMLRDAGEMVSVMKRRGHKLLVDFNF
jgi:hypothetical protein